MRTIKFRAWDKNQKIMATRHDCDPTFNWLSETNPTIFEVRADNFILMQYTGLKDKNGKEIWESDIVQYVGIDGDVEGRIMEVNYPECFDSEADGSLYRPESWKVIGNIWENPELLKGKE